MKLSCKKIFVWSLSILLFVGVMSSGHSNTFCIGEDRAVETNFQSCCIEKNEGCSNNSQVGFEDCADCIDIELDTPLLSVRTQDDNLNKSKFNSTIQQYNNFVGILSFSQNAFFLIKSQCRTNLINYSKILSSVIFLC